MANKLVADIKSSNIQKELCADDIVNMVTGNSADVAQ
jgi:hypothetical protein